MIVPSLFVLYEDRKQDSVEAAEGFRYCKNPGKAAVLVDCIRLRANGLKFSPASTYRCGIVSTPLLRRKYLGSMCLDGYNDGIFLYSVARGRQLG